MRFRLIIKIVKDKSGNKLPVNYSHQLSSWIYSVVAQNDAAYTSWLHDHSFTDDQRKQRLFVFSGLHIPKIRIEGDYLYLLSDTVSFYLSFIQQISVEEFVMKMFSNQRFTLGDSHFKVHMEVKQVEKVPDPDLRKPHRFQTLSPVVISNKEPDGRISYVSPERKDYPTLLFNRLKEKYKTYYKKEFAGSNTFRFELVTIPQLHLITVRAGQPDEINLRAYHYTFYLTADIALLELAYHAGLGEKGSIGFGMIRICE